MITIDGRPGSAVVEESTTIQCHGFFSSSRLTAVSVLAFLFCLVGSHGTKGSSFGQKWVFYGVLRRSWDLHIHFQLIEMSMLIFFGLAEVDGT